MFIIEQQVTWRHVTNCHNFSAPRHCLFYRYFLYSQRKPSVNIISRSADIWLVCVLLCTRCSAFCSASASTSQRTQYVSTCSAAMATVHCYLRFDIKPERFVWCDVVGRPEVNWRGGNRRPCSAVTGRQTASILTFRNLASHIQDGRKITL